MWKFGLLVVCLCFSAMFSAAETALMSLSKIRVRQMVENEEKGADIIDKLISNPSKLLSAILIGNNVVNIGASSIMTSLAIDFFGSKGVGIATGVMTLLILVFGEITPKSLAVQNSEKISLKISKFIYFLTIVLSPIISVLTFVTNFFVKMLGGDLNIHQPFITQEELKTIVGVSHKEGVLEGEETEMIYNVFDFSDSQVKDVMVTRTEMVALDIDTPYNEIIEVIMEEQYSRIPVYEDTIDNIMGILYAKDLLFLEATEESFNLREFLREPYFTYEFKMTKQLFKEMRIDRIHMAVVLDEYGGTEGIITIEDLIEEIVGDIEDEYDKEVEEIQVIKEDEYIVLGNVRLEDLNEMVGTNIESEDFDTIGGFIIGILEKLPDVGEIIKFENMTFTVEEVNRNKIEKIRMTT